MVLHAAWMLDQGLDAREQIAMVKVHAAETLGRVVDRAVQIFGGMGFCKELPIERYYRDARIYRIFDGTSRDPPQRDCQDGDEKRRGAVRREPLIF